MIACSLVALLALAGPGEATAPVAADAFPLVPHSAPSTPMAPPQGTVLVAKPRFFVAVGAQYIDSQVRSPTGNDPDAGTGYSADFGFVTWNGDLGLAVEGGVIMNSYDLDTSLITTESVDARRFLLGVRFMDDSADSWFVWHARGGLAWRQDDGQTVISDDGFGWYAGGGAEWKFGDVFSLGPSLLYMKTESVNSSEWMLGLNATFRFG